MNFKEIFGKMHGKIMILLKVTKEKNFTLYLENVLSEKP